jgi:pimeloyl-ACP methyl ester carboxylesterase
MTRPVHSSDDIVNAALLCLATKQASPDVSGWEPISLEDLDMPEGYEPDGRYINKNAFAFVRTMEVNGEKTLALVFKGTDKFCYRDWKDNLTNINSHYEKMRPLIDALDRYVERQNISRVMVAGHSLGGAMVAKYMEEHQKAETGIQYAGISFGSPGGIFPDDYYDPRMVCIRHERDAIPRIASKRSKVAAGYRWPGRIIQVQESDKARFRGFVGLFRSHSIREYLATAQHLAQEKVFEIALKVDRDILLGRSGDPRDPEKRQARILSDLPDVDLTIGEKRILDESEDQVHELDDQDPEVPGEDLEADQGMALAM